MSKKRNKQYNKEKDSSAIKHISTEKTKIPSLNLDQIIPWLRFFVYSSLGVFLLPFMLFFQEGLPSGHDIVIHTLYLKIFTNALALGQFPVRWIDWIYPGYNQPLFNFYQPLFYYSFQLPHILGFSNTDGLKLLLVGLWIVSGIFMYLFVRRHFGKLEGMIAAILYMFAPYHLVDLFVRAAYPEFMALAVVPALFWSIKSYADTKKLYYISLSALFFAAIILSHPPTLLMFSPLLVLYCVYIGFDKKSYTIPFLLGFGFFLGVIVSSFFLLPTLLEQQYIQSFYLHAGYYNFHQHFVCAAQTIVPSWGYGTSTPGCNDQMSFQVGLIHWVAILTMISVLIYNRYQKKQQQTFLPLLFLGVFFVSLFMTTELSKSIWEAIPQFAFIQYPWRFLSVAIFTSSFLGAVLLSYVSNFGYKLLFYLVSICLILLVYGSYMHPAQYVKSSELNFDESALILPDNLDAQPELGYMPKDTYVLLDKATKVSQEVKTLYGSARIIKSSKTPTKKTYVIDAQKPTRFIFFIHNFPGWTATVDGVNVPITLDNIYGFIEVSTATGIHTIDLQFKDTAIRLWSNRITIVGLLILLLVAIPYRIVRKILLKK